MTTNPTHPSTPPTAPPGRQPPGAGSNPIPTPTPSGAAGGLINTVGGVLNSVLGMLPKSGHSTTSNPAKPHTTASPKATTLPGLLGGLLGITGK